MGTTAEAANHEEHRHNRRDNTPWGLWTTIGKEKKDHYVTQGSMTATMNYNRRHIVSVHMKGKEHDDFARKAWIHG